MKKNYIWGALMMASLAFTACSSDEISEDLSNSQPVPEAQIDESFKELGEFSVASKLGNSTMNQGMSRTEADIDDKARPTGIYPLNKIGLLALRPTQQPTQSNEGKIYDPLFDVNAKTVFQDITEKGYKVYYKLEDVQDNSKYGASNSGRIVLCGNRYGKDCISFDLSVFALEDLDKKSPDHIKLNKFAYGKGVKGNLRGTSLRYVSYDPKNDFESFPGAESRLVGKIAELPEITDPQFDFLKSGDPDYPLENILYTETQDKYFAGNEILFAAAGDKIYLMETIPVQSSRGGYYLRKTYPSPDGSTMVNEVNMERLTTIVNTSFMLVDQAEFNESSYFKVGDKAKTLANFKKKFGVDLSDLECPYATFDGFNGQFFINEYKNLDRSERLGRMIMWAKGLPITAANGETYTKEATASMDIVYDHGSQGKVRRGYGIKGNSWSVAFQGSDKDTQDKEINFWTTVDGARVKISATTGNTGITFQKNYAHNVIVFINAEQFAQAVKDYKEGKLPYSRANGFADYIEIKVPAENVVVE